MGVGCVCDGVVCLRSDVCVAIKESMKEGTQK